MIEGDNGVRILVIFLVKETALFWSEQLINVYYTQLGIGICMFIVFSGISNRVHFFRKSFRADWSSWIKQIFEILLPSISIKKKFSSTTTIRSLFCNNLCYLFKDIPIFLISIYIEWQKNYLLEKIFSKNLAKSNWYLLWIAMMH